MHCRFLLHGKILNIVPTRKYTEVTLYFTPNNEHYISMVFAYHKRVAPLKIGDNVIFGYKYLRFKSPGYYFSVRTLVYFKKENQNVYKLR